MRQTKSLKTGLFFEVEKLADPSIATFLVGDLDSATHTLNTALFISIVPLNYPEVILR